ncbi:MAG: hypothetical protein JJU05_09030 [Verrucomicrobia bacterium]|nr:hypothetical protein [Verrucomicrobiota bacterium]MCH8526966.1 non-lysosomal glucosylceramidase [Kiritimatiellia bacterium]
MLTPSNIPVYSGSTLLQIALPMGGIGAGCICLTGHGSLEDFSIRNSPSTSALPDGHQPGDAAFALLRIQGENPLTRLVEGPMPKEKIYNLGLQGQGFRKGGYEGLPRFRNCEFSGYFPFGTVSLSDPKVPLTVDLRGWSPFIPLDDLNSGIPCSILEYTLHNRSDSEVTFGLSFHLSHLARGKSGWTATRNERIPGGGIFFRNNEKPNAASFGSAALVALQHHPKIKTMWLRSGWFDAVSTLWRQIDEGKFAENDAPDRDFDGRNGGSILVEAALKPGEKTTIPFAVTWHFPNPRLVTEPSNPACGNGCGSKDDPPAWRPCYVKHWKDAREVAAHVKSHFEELRRRTETFAAALTSSTLPGPVLEAVADNLAILKSPTVIRQENGNVWGWEGCFTNTAGCCGGTCTHVWNYAQALPHLFPSLERTLREQELCRSMDARGHVDFRAALPDGPTPHRHRGAADGQLGGIMKVYRDWQIGGCSEWLHRLYPLVRRSIDYCIETWDPDRRGALFEPHHNTYDIEFWGPDGMCTGIYLGALAAMAEMAAALGKPEASSYTELAERGAAFIDKELFNGEYFEQKVLWKSLRESGSFLEYIGCESITEEERSILRRDGPNYQYGAGCMSDGVIGAWMAKIYGIDSPQNRENIRSTLRAIVRHNFKQNLFEHPNTQRPGYAIGDEAGLLVCTWPRGERPGLPFPYADEVFTGIEYQVASHLIEEGMAEEGLKLVEAARSRYDGHTRNPFNEYECGNYYARAMSSYALLGSLSGFRYSAVSKTLRFGPRVDTMPFQVFFSTASAWGTVRLENGALIIKVIEGELRIEKLIFTLGERSQTFDWKITASASDGAVSRNFACNEKPTNKRR